MKKEEILNGRSFRIWNVMGNEYRIEKVGFIEQLGILILFAIVATIVGWSIITSHGLPLTGETAVRYSQYESWNHGVRIDDVEIGDSGLGGRRCEVDIWNSTDKRVDVKFSLIVDGKTMTFLCNLEPREKTWLSEYYHGSLAPAVKVDWHKVEQL